MSKYTAKIYLDYSPEYTILMEQERPWMGQKFICDVELCMDTMPGAHDRIKAVIARDDKEIACMIRNYFRDGSQIRTVFALKDGWPMGMCSRFIPGRK